MTTTTTKILASSYSIYLGVMLPPQLSVAQLSKRYLHIFSINHREQRLIMYWFTGRYDLWHNLFYWALIYILNRFIRLNFLPFSLWPSIFSPFKPPQSLANAFSHLLRKPSHPGETDSLPRPWNRFKLSNSHWTEIKVWILQVEWRKQTYSKSWRKRKMRGKRFRVKFMLTELICRARSSLESMYFSAHGHHVNDFPNWAARRGSSRSAWLGLPQYGKTVGSRAAPHQTEPTATLVLD